ncbi:MAG: hypothetical protein D3911_07890 [Candidatus Electrothrix sp. AW3_4]|nr:hypothetical protein [Candidatus Electrothrix gigas]
MRLRDIISVFSAYIPDIRFDTAKIDNNNIQLRGVSRFRSALQALENTGVFEQEIETIKEFKAICLTTEDTVALPLKEGHQLVNLTNQLQNKVSIADVVLRAILPPQDLNSLSLKLPKINSLKELSDLSAKLDKIFDQLLVNDFVKGKASLQNFDTGSEWLEIVFNSTKAVGLVASVVYAALVVKREHIKNQELLEVVRNRKITNDLYEDLSRSLSEDYKKLLEDQAKKIATDAGADENDHEYLGRIKFCIDELKQLIDKGLKFFPSSKSPSEIQSKLPDFSKNTIEEMLPDVKKLPEKTSENTAQQE